MLSVIIPAYNEDLSVERAYYTISEILREAEIDNEIIFIDDGSTDATYEKIKNLADKEKNISNCPLCAIGNGNNKTRLWKLAEMDADHVTAWSKGGASDVKNCQMLCKTHNRAKGNK